MKNRISIWEFMPLPGDPTKEQLQEIERKEAAKLQDEMNRVLEEYKALGYDFSDIKFSA